MASQKAVIISPRRRFTQSWENAPLFAVTPSRKSFSRSLGNVSGRLDSTLVSMLLIIHYRPLTWIGNNDTPSRALMNIRIIDHRLSAAAIFDKFIHAASGIVFIQPARPIFENDTAANVTQKNIAD